MNNMDEKLRKVIAFLMQEVKKQNERLASLEHTVNDVVVASLVEANDQYEYDTGLEAFRGAHPELADLDPRLKGLYGDEYDTAKAFYDARPESYAEGQDEASWVADMLKEVIARLDAAAGKPEAPVVEETKVVSEEEAPQEMSDEELKNAYKAAKGE